MKKILGTAFGVLVWCGLEALGLNAIIAFIIGVLAASFFGAFLASLPTGSSVNDHNESMSERLEK